MSDFFADLETQLHTAARARAARRRRARLFRLPSLHRSFRALPVLAGVGVALAVAAIALVVAVHGHGGSSQSAGGPPTPGQVRQESGYIRQASQQAHKAGACQSRRTSTGPRTSNGMPSELMLSTLAVLRRAATGADKLPARVTLGGDVAGVYVRFTRLARVVNGISYYVVPAKTNLDRPALTARCAAAITTTLHAELPQIPPNLRAPTLALERKLLAADTTKPAVGGVVCLIVAAARASGGTCGSDPAEIKAYGMLGEEGRVSGIVPDGVASVTLRYPARTVTLNVVNNVFAAPHPSSGRLTRPPSILWRDASGKAIKTVPADTPRTGGSGFCQSSSRGGNGVC
jgi:hypothetical protein